MAANISFEDYFEISNLAFTWSTAYDTKHWALLQPILAPSIRLDFTSLQGELHDKLSPHDYVAILIAMIGEKKLKTQHLMGAKKWTVLEDGSVEIWHQMRVAHQRYADDALTTVVNKGHAHGFVIHKYRKFDGTWKIEGVRPQLEWTEYDLFGTLNPTDTNAPAKST